MPSEFDNKICFLFNTFTEVFMLLIKISYTKILIIMKFTKFDIGADIISILTRGMYPDPKDALREYIQNGVDAKAKQINVKIRLNNIIVEDDGLGMDYETLRRAARIGVSDKNPSKDVGFMGIGIYSSYHLCDKLIITSKKLDNKPNVLSMNFSGMKSVLLEQRKLRLDGEIDSDQQIDLQSLLERFVILSEKDEIDSSEFPADGTRVEMQGVSGYFYSEISNFEKTSTYLQDVVPLRFDRESFKYAEIIEKSIIEACEKNGSSIELIDLSLQVNSITKNLHRPYSDNDFEGGSLEPKVAPLNIDGVFFGVIWGCLNMERKKIRNNDIRGFILKKQGFAIGKRSDLIRHFPRSNAFFDRYIGEIIITNSLLLPNASRNDLEYSVLREQFFASLTIAAADYDSFANQHQEDCKADDIMDTIIKESKAISIQVNQSLQDSDNLLHLYTVLSKNEAILQKRIHVKRIRESRSYESKELLKEIKKLMAFIKFRLDINKEKKAGNSNPIVSKNINKSSTFSISKKLNELQISNETSEMPNRYETLLSLVEDLEFKYDDNIQMLLEIIDERFIQALATSKDEYYNSLESLKQEFFNNEE